MASGAHDGVRRQYARFAASYDERWAFYIDASVRETVRRLPFEPGAARRILDVGCGTGVLLERIRADHPEASLSGIDLSREMLEIARRRLGAGIGLVEGSADDLPFGDESFDLVVSTNVFHYFRRPRNAVVEALRVLRRPGAVLITDWCDDYLACRACSLFLRLFEKAHFRTYTSRECLRIIESAGGSHASIERYRINWLWGLMTAMAWKS